MIWQIGRSGFGEHWRGQGSLGLSLSSNNSCECAFKCDKGVVIVALVPLRCFRDLEIYGLWSRLVALVALVEERGSNWLAEEYFST